MVILYWPSCYLVQLTTTRTVIAFALKQNIHMYVRHCTYGHRHNVASIIAMKKALVAWLGHFVIFQYFLGSPTSLVRMSARSYTQTHKQPSYSLIYIYIYIYIYSDTFRKSLNVSLFVPHIWLNIMADCLLNLGKVLFTNPSARAGYDTRSIFKRSLTGLNSEFSFS